jgi:hypothetical protein
MRRATVLLSVVALVLVGLVGLGRVGAQEATPVAGPPETTPVAGTHPIVGSWLADTDADDPTNPPALFAFHADGTYVQSEVEGVSVGTWEATGDRTATLTLHSIFLDEAGGQFMVTVRAAIEVAADGQSFAASFTLELTLPDGTSTGEYGPGTATGTRIAVEVPGEPVGPLEDLFGQFEEIEPTPEA